MEKNNTKKWIILQKFKDGEKWLGAVDIPVEYVADVTSDELLLSLWIFSIALLEQYDKNLPFASQNHQDLIDEIDSLSPGYYILKKDGHWEFVKEQELLEFIVDQAGFVV